MGRAAGVWVAAAGHASASPLAHHGMVCLVSIYSICTSSQLFYVYISTNIKNNLFLYIYLSPSLRPAAGCDGRPRAGAYVCLDLKVAPMKALLSVCVSLLSSLA